jgi:type I restriction enzyme M protein
MTTITELFHVKRGKGEYRENLEVGNTPLVSATNTNNGIIDHVDIESTFKAPAITVERVTGQAYVQLFDFATVPDDITVLVPKEEMSLQKLFYIAAQINLLKWRFNYARKLTPTRLKSLEVDLSNFRDENESPKIFLSRMMTRLTTEAQESLK